MSPAPSQKTFVASFAIALLVAGCGPEFDPPSRIDSLRVLAVQKDRPYANPGEEVRLTMLWADGAEDAGPERPIEIRWLGGCHNPLGDLYARCFADALPSDDDRGEGDEFVFRVPETIISSRPPPADSRQPPYGLSYVFFAACAGTFARGAGAGPSPPLCVGRNGEALGSDDFVAGYTAIYSYEEFDNQNPIVGGLSLDGRTLAGVCVDPASAEAIREGDPGALLGRAAAGANGGEPPPACDGGPALEPSEPPDCTQPNAPCLPKPYPGAFSGGAFDVRPEIHRASIEQDEISKVAYGRDYEEQMWINYYATRGELKTDVRLLNDATTGLNDDFATVYYATLEPGPVTLWAVVHDNRGGVAWARGTVWIE